MTVLKIETDDSPNSVLRQKSAEVTNVLDPHIQTLIDDMWETLNAAKGIGLAAPQVGAPVRIILVKTNNFWETLVNPTFAVRMKTSTKIEEEGCLSIPDVWAYKKRQKYITVSYIDRFGAEKEVKLFEKPARVVQHEVDHLNGILFTDN